MPIDLLAGTQGRAPTDLLSSPAASGGATWDQVRQALWPVAKGETAQGLGGTVQAVGDAANAAGSSVAESLPFFSRLLESMNLPGPAGVMMLSGPPPEPGPTLSKLKTVGQPLSDVGAGIAESGRRDVLAATPADMSLLQRTAVNSAGMSLPLILSMLSGDPYVAAGLFGAGAGGQEYSEDVASGMSKGDAARLATGKAASTAGIGLLPAGAAMREAPSAGARVWEFLKTAFPSMEALTAVQGAQDVLAGKRDTPTQPKTLTDWLEHDLPQEALDTAATTVAMGALPATAHGVGKVVDRVRSGPTLTKEQVTDRFRPAYEPRSSEAVPGQPRPVADSMPENPEPPLSDVKPVFSRAMKPGERDTRHDFIVPDEPALQTPDLAEMPAEAVQGSGGTVEALPIRLTRGAVKGPHRGFGVAHIADVAARTPDRQVPQATGDQAENVAREVYRLANNFSEVYRDGDRLVLRDPASKQALVAERRTDPSGQDYYSVVSRVPAAETKQWGEAAWTGRRQPVSESLRPGAPGLPPGQPAEAGQQPERQPLGVQTVPFSLDEKAPTVQYKKRRTIVPPEDGGQGRSSLPGEPPAATGAHPERLQAAVSEIGSRLKGAPEVHVVGDVSELPEAAHARLDEESRQARARGETPPEAPDGFYHQGKVYLVASRLPTPERAAEVYFHEVVGHRGLRGLLGDKLNGVLDEIGQAYAGGRFDQWYQGDQRNYLDLSTIAREYGHGGDYRALDEEARREVAEEYLARLAESGAEKSGFLDRVRRMVANLLRRVQPGRDITKQDVDELLASARGFIERGKAGRTPGQDEPSAASRPATYSERRAALPEDKRDNIHRRTLAEHVSLFPDYDPEAPPVNELARRGNAQGLRGVKREHRAAVETAISQGDAVPSEVLADYPDLREHAAAQEVAPDAPPATPMPSDEATRSDVAISSEPGAEGATNIGAAGEPVKAGVTSPPRARTGEPGEPDVFSRPARLDSSTPEQKRRVIETFRDIAQRAIHRFEDVTGLDPFRSLPDRDKFLSDRYRTLGKIADAERVSKEIKLSLFNAPTPEDKAAAYEYLTTAGADASGIKNPDARAAAVRAKRLLNKMSDELVERGLLSPESREQYRDSYLPRIYFKYLLDNRDYLALGSGKKPSAMGYLKKRQDIPDEIRRVVLGEVRDPGFLASVSLGRSMRDVALLDWLDSISQHDKWVLPEQLVDWEGHRVTPYWLKSEAERLRVQARHYTDAGDATKARELAERMDQAGDEALQGIAGKYSDYKQLPDTARYGRLRGMYVRKEIYDDIMGVGHMMPEDPNWFQNIFWYGGVGTKATQLWKMTKVALNPPGQVRNFVSNNVMLQLSGVPLHSLPRYNLRAIEQIRTDGKYWQIAKKYGVTESTFANQELARVKRDILDLEKSEGTLGTLGKLHRYGAMVADAASDVYQLMEAVGKTIKIMHGMEKQGLTEQQAVTEAQNWLFDYSMVPGWVRAARNAPVGIPFLTYQVKVLPRLMEVALLHPQRFLPWAALFMGWQYGVAGLLGVAKEDLDALKKALPDWLQSKGHVLMIPYRDQYGRWSFLDMSYFMPWTMWTQFGNDVVHGNVLDSVQDLGLFSGPITEVITAMKSGVDSFSRRPIVPDNAPPLEQYMALMSYAWDMLAPPFLTEHGAAGHLYHALRGDPDRYGDPKDTVAQALLRVMGVNLYAIEPQVARQQNIRHMVADIEDVMSRAKYQVQAARPQDRAAVAREYRDEIKRRAGLLREYEQESQVNPKLLDRNEPAPQEAVPGYPRPVSPSAPGSQPRDLLSGSGPK